MKKQQKAREGEGGCGISGMTGEQWAIFVSACLCVISGHEFLVEMQVEAGGKAVVTAAGAPPKLRLPASLLLGVLSKILPRGALTGRGGAGQHLAVREGSSVI